ncbi:hypothetical protein CR513_23559, partial [Mucuna pruriens]
MDSPSFMWRIFCVQRSTGIWWKMRFSEAKVLRHSTSQACTVASCRNSSSAIKLSKNRVMHGHCKHIDVRFHFLRDLTKAGTIKMMHCSTQEQVTDIMTKPLKLDVFLKLYSFQQLM